MSDQEPSHPLPESEVLHTASEATQALIDASDKLDEDLARYPEFTALRSITLRNRDLIERQRRMSRIVVTGFALLVIVAGILGVALVRVQNNADRISKTTNFAEAAAANLKAICEGSNADRAVQVQIWNYVLARLSQDGNSAFADALQPNVESIPPGPERETWDALLTALRTSSTNQNPSFAQGLKPLVDKAYAQHDCHPAGATTDPGATTS